MLLLTVEEEKVAHEAGRKTMEHMIKYLDRFAPSYIAMAVVESAIKAVETMREEKANVDQGGN
jgi:hypothetical protein